MGNGDSGFVAMSKTGCARARGSSRYVNAKSRRASLLGTGQEVRNRMGEGTSSPGTLRAQQNSSRQPSQMRAESLQDQKMQRVKVEIPSECDK